MSTFTLGLIQMRANPSNEDRLAHALSLIYRAVDQGAQIIVLPELFRHAYPCQRQTPSHFKFAETVPGNTTQTLTALANQLNVVIIASLFEEHMPGQYFNTAVVIDADGTFLGKYRKAHIPDDPLYNEKFYFTPGDTGFPVFQTQYAKISVLVCWDQWFPEPARLAAMAGAEVIIYPTAIGSIEAEGPAEHLLQQDAWTTIQRSHAIANGLYVAAVNRVGREGGLDFWGSSFACGPQGEVLDEASDTEEEILIVACDRQQPRTVRDLWPFFRDRRADLYSDLLKRSL